MGIGSAIGGIVSGALGLFGNHQQNKYNAAMSEADRAFQREVYQNQLQWKAQDAKKAGLHPLAAIGGGAYSASPSSIPAVDMSSSLGKLGAGIGDAFTAYMNKDQIAEQAAKADQRADEQHEANMRESAARTLMYNGQALEATRRASSYSVPMASGLESIPGQVDARPSKSYMENINKFAWPRNPDGSRGDPIPSSEYKEIYEDVPILEFFPFLDASYHKWRAILTRSRIDGYRRNWGDNSWTR